MSDAAKTDNAAVLALERALALADNDIARTHSKVRDAETKADVETENVRFWKDELVTLEAKRADYAAALITLASR
jgi:hypothetical protein